MMFTGLVEEIGRVEQIRPAGGGARIAIAASKVLDELQLGDSIAVNGVCLTVVEKKDRHFTVETVQETLERTTLSMLRPGQRVNLERSLTPNSRMGGHFVQGHVDGVGEIRIYEKREPGYWLGVVVPEALLPFFVQKGSVAIDGISLTIAEIRENVIFIALIPHTASATILGNKKVSDRVNIEVDILGKYVHRVLELQKNGRIDMDKLKNWGY